MVEAQTRMKRTCSICSRELLHPENATVIEAPSSICTICRRSGQQLLVRQNSRMVGLADLRGMDPNQLLLAELVRWQCWLVIRPEIKPVHVTRYAEIFNICLEVRFWLERRDVLWEPRVAWRTLCDLLLMGYKEGGN